MHPTLLIGPYDWDSQCLPESEFRERIKAFWEKIPDSTISRAIVYGDNRNHAELDVLEQFLAEARSRTPAGSKERRTDAVGFRRAEHALRDATDNYNEKKLNRSATQLRLCANG